MSANSKFVCTRCGSDEVEAEAYANWDIAHQTWVYDLKENGDYDYCYNCEDTAVTDERPLTDLKDIALVAAHTPIFKSVRSNPDANCVHR